MRDEMLLTGGVVVGLPGSVKACRKVMRDLEKAFSPHGVGIKLVTVSSSVEAIGGTADDLCRPSEDLRAIANTLSRDIGISRDVFSEVVRVQPALVAVWADTKQLATGHLIAKFFRDIQPADVCTAIAGPGISDNIERWFRSPALLESILEQVGFYIAGDPVVGLTALLRDCFRVEHKLWTVPGLVWLEDGEIRMNKPNEAPPQTDAPVA